MKQPKEDFLYVLHKINENRIALSFNNVKSKGFSTILQMRLTEKTIRSLRLIIFLIETVFCCLGSLKFSSFLP